MADQGVQLPPEQLAYVIRGIIFKQNRPQRPQYGAHTPVKDQQHQIQMVLQDEITNAAAAAEVALEAEDPIEEDLKEDIDEILSKMTLGDPAEYVQQ